MKIFKILDMIINYHVHCTLYLYNVFYNLTMFQCTVYYFVIVPLIQGGVMNMSKEGIEPLIEGGMMNIS